MRYEEKQTKYFDSIVKTWRAYPKGHCHPFPWRFSVTSDGKETLYAGMPNQCETRRSALKRGWYRAKWEADGSIVYRYVRR